MQPPEQFHFELALTLCLFVLLPRAAAVVQRAYGWRQHLHGTVCDVTHAGFIRSFLRRNG